MSGLQKKSINKYISNRVKYWAYSINNPKILATIIDLEYDNKIIPQESNDEFTQLEYKVVDEAALKSHEEANKEKIAEFQQAIIDDVIVTGGCIASLLMGEEVNDVDIYFQTKDIAVKVAKYYLFASIERGDLSESQYIKRIGVDETSIGVNIMIRSQGVTGIDINTDNYRYFEMSPAHQAEEFFEQYHKAVRNKIDKLPKHTVQFLSSNAVTLTNGIQLILRFVGDVDFIHQNFDFVHATNYWTKEEGVVYRQEALESILEKRLKYIGSYYPVSTIFRLRKFISRGWKISAGEIVKIAFDTSKLDLSNINVLRDQTMGMDSAYFSQVIRLLESKNELESPEVLDRTYLFQAISAVFDRDEDVNDEGEIFVGDDENTLNLEG